MSTLTARLVAAPQSRWRTLVVVALLLLALAVGAVFVGSRRQAVPPPFGAARNGMLAFDSDGDIYVADPVTGASRLVLGGPDTDRYAMWSHDGTRFGFIREMAKVDQYSEGLIFVAAADGSAPTQVTPTILKAITWSQFSPDDRSMVVAAGGASLDASTSSVTIAATDGSEAHVLGLGGRLPAGFVALSPAFRPVDGSELLVTGYGPTQGGVYLVNVDGTDFRTLVEPAGDGVHFNEATWSPDGSRIAYTREEHGLWQVHVLSVADRVDHVVHVDGAVSEGWPAWSPDGSRVVFQVTMSAGPSLHAIMLADGTGQPIKVDSAMGPSGASYVWAPDGKSVLAVSLADPTKQQLWDAGTGAVTTAPWTAKTYPSWQRLAP